MPYDPMDIACIMPGIREMFRISSELEQAFPGRRFTLDGHLVGSIGEILAAYHYGLELLPSSSERHDAVASDGHMVQIKATQGKGHIALRSEPEHLIVLWINSESGEAREVYNGPGAPAWETCGKWASNGTRPISLAKLRKMAERVSEGQRIRQVHPFDALPA